jgi:homoserine kinase
VKSVRLNVPASTANLGPGFDALGLALELRNTVEMESIEEGLVVEIEGEGADELPRDAENLMVKAARILFDRVGRKPKGLKLKAVNRIPLRSGLGSSAAAVVGALAAANVLVNGGLSTDVLLQLALDLEGHADNAAASFYGGLNVVAATEGEVLVRQIPIPSIRVAVALPSFGLSTQSMRQALPKEVPLKDAAANIGHALLTVEALRSGDYALLGRVMTDRLHQAHRARHIPGFEQVVRAARQAGAAAVALSGAGPSLVAFAPSGHDRIARAMVEAWAGAGIEARDLTMPVAEQSVLRE